MKNVFLSLVLIFSYSNAMATESAIEKELQRRITLAEGAQAHAYFQAGVSRSSIATKVLSLTVSERRNQGIIGLSDQKLCSIQSALPTPGAPSNQFEITCYDEKGKVSHQEFVPFVGQ